MCSQAFFTGIQGGNPFVGFASGALSSVASSLYSLDYNGAKDGLGFGGNFRSSGLGMVAFGTVMGGAGASLTGGNFWQEAATGLVVSGLNHLVKKEFANDKKKNIVSKNHKKGNIINLHSKSRNPGLYEYAEQSTGDGYDVELHAHGSSSSVHSMTTVEEIDALLYNSSPKWRDMVDNGTKIKLKLYACSTANGKNSIAEKLSNFRPNAQITEPTSLHTVEFLNIPFFGVKILNQYIDNGTWKTF